MTVTAPIDLSPVDDFDPDIELADFLAGGRPCETPVPAGPHGALFDLPGIRVPWRECGKPAVVAHLLRPTDGCTPDRWLYICGDHDDGNWQCFRHHQPVVAVASYRIGWRPA
jgi:hypothetical protein